MKIVTTLVLLLGFLSLMMSFDTLMMSFHGIDEVDQKIIKFYVPEAWPKTSYDFSNNPLTQAKIDLGRKLFYDEKLSADSSISCAGCHLSYTGFTHIDHSLSHGVEDRIGSRNTLAIINPAWQKTFMWDGGINHLEKQPLAPLTSHAEMDNSLENVQAYLDDSDDYQGLFVRAFGVDKVSIPNTLKALTAFMLQFNSYNSKYDKVMREEDGFAFTARESKGYELFKSECASCHKEPLFANDQFMSNGIGVDTSLNDKGRMLITGNKSDSLLFRVPTLRNIEVTRPYMHDGRFVNLQMVMYHYGKEDKDRHNLSPELQKMKLTESEKGEIIAFLKTLTDVSFLRNTDLAYPR